MDDIRDCRLALEGFSPGSIYIVKRANGISGTKETWAERYCYIIRVVVRNNNNNNVYRNKRHVELDQWTIAAAVNDSFPNNGYHYYRVSTVVANIYIHIPTIRDIIILRKSRRRRKLNRVPADNDAAAIVLRDKKF